MHEKDSKYVGTRHYINDGSDMKNEYMTLAINNQKAAELLMAQGLYNEAVFLYIQAMEKKIKSYICGIINVTQVCYADKLREVGHSLDKSILFLIDILSKRDDALKGQLQQQLLSGVFENIRFSNLYNDCRYPHYLHHTSTYAALNISCNDCKRIQGISKKLDRFLGDFHKL